MRKTQRLISLGLGLTLSLLTAWPAAAQTEPPVNINSADAKTLARAIDGLSLKQAEAIMAFRVLRRPREGGGRGLEPARRERAYTAPAKRSARAGRGHRCVTREGQPVTD